MLLALLRGNDGDQMGDCVLQDHIAPGIYARSFLEPISKVIEQLPSEWMARSFFLPG